MNIYVNVFSLAANSASAVRNILLLKIHSLESLNIVCNVVSTFDTFVLFQGFIDQDVNFKGYTFFSKKKPQKNMNKNNAGQTFTLGKNLFLSIFV